MKEPIIFKAECPVCGHIATVMVEYGEEAIYCPDRHCPNCPDRE